MIRRIFDAAFLLIFCTVAWLDRSYLGTANRWDFAPAADQIKVSGLPLESFFQQKATPPPLADRAVTGEPLVAGGKLFESGIGVHADSVLRFKTAGAFRRFRSTIGITGEAAGLGSVQFTVLADGEALYTSPVFHQSGDYQHIDIDIGAAILVELRVNDGGDGTRYDHGAWIDPEFIPR